MYPYTKYQKCRTHRTRIKQRLLWYRILQLFSGFWRTTIVGCCRHRHKNKRIYARCVRMYVSIQCLHIHEYFLIYVVCERFLCVRVCVYVCHVCAHVRLLWTHTHACIYQMYAHSECVSVCVCACVHKVYISDRSVCVRACGVRARLVG